jgi:flagellar biosynthesis component FlhA
MSDKTIEEFVPSFDENDSYVVTVDGEFAEKLANKIQKKAKQLNIENPVIIVPMEFQHLVSALLSNYLNNISVITHEEIGCNYRIETLAEI